MVANRILLGIACGCLLCGLLLPWVRLASSEEKAKNLAQLATLLEKAEALPSGVHVFLQEHGWQNYRQPDLQIFFVEDLALGEAFTYLYTHNRLFSWSFFQLPSAGLTRLLILGLWGLCLAAGTTSVFLWQQNLTQSTSIEDEHVIDGINSASSNIRVLATALSVTAFVLLFLFVLQLPLLDTLGHPGDRPLAFTGVILGARVTWVPRLFIPVGLLMIILAGVESALSLASGRGSLFVEGDF